MLWVPQGPSVFSPYDKCCACTFTPSITVRCISPKPARNRMTEWHHFDTCTKKNKQFFDSWSFLVFFYLWLAVVIFRSYKKYALKEIIWCIIFSGFLSFPLTLFSLMCLHEVQSAECFLSSVLLSFSSASKKSPSCHPLWLSVFLFQLTTCYFQILLEMRQLIFCRHFISIHWPSSVYHGWFGNKAKVCSFLCHSFPGLHSCE